MDGRARGAFLALILSQAAHSVEEYALRLFDVFAPARFVSSLVGEDRATGFLLVNLGLVLFGLWCWAARVRPGRPSARPLAWFWAVLELANGAGHLVLAAGQGGYFPGAATAPLLLGVAGYLVVRLSRATPTA
jgi:Protein of unknown function with HXXEE motif